GRGAASAARGPRRSGCAAGAAGRGRVHPGREPVRPGACFAAGTGRRSRGGVRLSGSAAARWSESTARLSDADLERAAELAGRSRGGRRVAKATALVLGGQRAALPVY